MQIALRVDASAAIGLGHVQRCLALAHALAEGGAQPVFVTRELGGDAARRIAAAGFDVHTLAMPDDAGAADATPPHAAWAGVPWRTDAEDTVRVLRASPPDWVIVDHYAFDARWHTEVAQALGSRIAIIDDVADRPLQCELLVDHNLASDHRRKYAGRLPETAMLLGGPCYALLGPVYADAPRCLPGDGVRSIGIFMGGADAASVTEQVLRACREVAGFEGLIEIVTTRANPHLQALRAAVESSPRTRLTIDLPDLAAFFARHDLQIGAGGGANWERCCLGAPTLALVIADNQQAVVSELAARGAVATLAPGDAPTAENIGRAVAALVDAPRRRQELAASARTLVDGLGACRVALRLLAPSLHLRRAQRHDAELVHRWRNHPAIRDVSRNAEPIAYEDHRRWMDRVIADPHRHLFVGMVGSRPVGVLRLDDDAQARCTEVSLFLDPGLQGLGLGPFLLRAGEQACGPKPAGWRYVATVLDRNPASRRLFTAAGYHFHGEQGEKPLAAMSSEDRSS